ncbi:MAG: hypothetical protein ABWZ40_13830 [Caulobacterales bacterium]
MTPSIEHRLDSVIRALSDIILPALPASANLATEQTRLAIGHLKILKAQIPLVHDFEEDETRDARALGEALLAAAQGGPVTQKAVSALRELMAVSACGSEINAGVVALLDAGAVDGESAFQRQSVAITIEHEAARALKDRKWFAPMGFDAEMNS